MPFAYLFPYESSNIALKYFYYSEHFFHVNFFSFYQAMRPDNVSNIQTIFFKFWLILSSKWSRYYNLLSAKKMFMKNSLFAFQLSSCKMSRPSVALFNFMKLSTIMCNVGTYKLKMYFNEPLRYGKDEK